MAYFRVNVENDNAFISQLNNLGDRAGEIAQLMLDDSSQILADAIEKDIRKNHSDSGELADSIETSDAEVDKDGVWKVWAYPSGRSKKKMHVGKAYIHSKHGAISKGKALYNGDKLYFIEYGTSKQAARPFMQRVANDAANEIFENMQEIFNREVE